MAMWLARTLKDHSPFASKRPQENGTVCSGHVERIHRYATVAPATYVRVNRPGTDFAGCEERGFFD